MIEALGLTKYYGMRPAVKNVSFSVKTGTIAGFLGVNGAGKTTTMRILACYLYPTEGTARVAGYDILERPLDVRKVVGYMPENPPLYNDMTVKSFLRFAAGLRGVPRRLINERIDYVIERCGLEEVYQRIIGRLSKGYRQRVGLAQALIHDPPILILDEPTVGLDPRQVLEIRELIRSLKDQHTILFSSHILYEVTQVCDAVIVIHEGEIVAQGTLEELQKGLLAETRLNVRFLHEPDNLESKLRDVSQRVRSVQQSGDDPRRYLIILEPDEEAQVEVIQWLARQNWGLLEARTETLTLEDIFIRLTTGEGVSLLKEEEAA